MKNLQLLISTLESVQNGKVSMGFDMSTSYRAAGEGRDLTRPKCKKACCIGGWSQAILIATSHLGASNLWKTETVLHSFRTLTKTDYFTALAICNPSFRNIKLRRISVATAIGLLRHFEITGKVDWKKALTASQPELAIAEYGA